MANQAIFMTGANGYIGSRITEYAIAEGYTVVGLSRSEKGDEALKALGASSVRGDLFSYDVLKEQSAKADIVIHLADALAQNMDKPYSKVVEIDNKATDAMTNGLKANKLLLITSGTLVTAAHPNHEETTETSPLWSVPLNDRIDCETHALKQAAAKGIRAVALRLAPYVYGRGGSGVRLFMGFGAQAGELAYVGNGSVMTSTVHVDDAARAYLLAIKKGRAGEAYNLTYETDVSAKDLYEAMGKALNLPVKAQPLATANATMGEFLARFISTENRASNAKAKSELGWQPKEVKIIDDILEGSYVEVANSMKK
ncbi:putative NAD dependent epimerase/dehydratase [Hypomontagnella monticulosa]|nr:putative NAD dependent epimerase/dehydratase [Hypomontagnella monticulosa]